MHNFWENGDKTLFGRDLLVRHIENFMKIVSTYQKFLSKIFTKNFLRQNHQTQSKYYTQRQHCVKGVQIRGFVWSAFSRIRAEYGQRLCIQYKCGKILTRTKLRIQTLHAVIRGSKNRESEFCVLYKSHGDGSDMASFKVYCK